MLRIYTIDIRSKLTIVTEQPCMLVHGVRAIAHYSIIHCNFANDVIAIATIIFTAGAAS